MGPNCNPEFTFNSRSFFTKEGRQSLAEAWNFGVDFSSPSPIPSQNVSQHRYHDRNNVQGRALDSTLSRTLERLGQGPIGCLRTGSMIETASRSSGFSPICSVNKLWWSYSDSNLAETYPSGSKCRYVRQGGQSISVADYFHNELNRPLRYPELICVEVVHGFEEQDVC